MACEVEVNDELSYGILNNSKNSISIDEGLPSEVALVCFLGEFYRILSRFLFCQGMVVSQKRTKAAKSGQMRTFGFCDVVSLHAYPRMIFKLFLQ